jgi:hypothetical protein
VLLALLAGLSAQAEPIAVEPEHMVTVGILTPQVIQAGHGQRLTIPQGWKADLAGALVESGYRVVPNHQAQVLLKPVVQASGCTQKRGELRCSAWVRWQVATGGNSPFFETETHGAGADLVDASRETWLAAFDELLSDPGFVQTLHYGPLSRYDCAFAGKMASVPTRVSPEPGSSRGSDPYSNRYDSAWTFGMILSTQEGYLLTGLALLGGGAAVVGASKAVSAATDAPSMELVLNVVALYGAAHVAVGASMLGLQFAENTRTRVHFTGNGVGITGRF